MKAPRLLQPLTRSRARLACTLGLVAAALLAGLLPVLLPFGDDGTAPRPAAATGGEPAGDAPMDADAAMARATETGEEVLVAAETTPTSQTWALPEGEYRSQIHALPQRARNNAEGTWADIDTTLEHTDQGVVPVNSATPLVFSAGTPQDERGSRDYRRAAVTQDADTADDAPEEAAGTVLAEVTVEGHTLTYTWPGTLPEPVLDGPRALYREVLEGVDLLIVAREEGGFGQLLIVKDAAAAAALDLADIAFGLSSPTATFQRNETTQGISVLDGEGEEITAIPSPFAWDSAGREPTDPTDPEAPAPPEPRTDTATAADVLNLTGLTGIEPGAAHAPMPTRLDGDGTSATVIHLDAAATGLFDEGADTLYPVFLDPTLNGGVYSWAMVYKPYPNSNYLNGTNYNGGTSEARVGYESQTGGLARSFWRMRFDNSLSGATVTSASFKVLNTHSWSCTTREMRLYRTGVIGSSTTWNNQPSWTDLLQKKSFAHGYSSSCPDEYVSFNIKDAAQDAVNGGWKTLTLGMRATTETSTYTWRKFKASSAQITVNYNRKPNEPTGGYSTPGGDCVPGPGNGITLAQNDITFTATGSDPDGNLDNLYFRVWPADDYDSALLKEHVTPNSSGKASATVLASQLADGVTYSWDVRSEDTNNDVSYFFPPGSEPCRFTVDASAPPTPVITSPDVADTPWDSGQWAEAAFGDPLSFTISTQGTDAVRYAYAFNAINYTHVTLDNPGDDLTVTLNPPNAGPVYFHVYAYDSAGNRSARAAMRFYLPARSEADTPGDLNGDGQTDLVIINSTGELRTYAGEEGGEVYSGMRSSYDSQGNQSPPGHFYDPDTGEIALISKYADYYPDDGLTDLFVVTPDDEFYLYPGDGFGTFNVDDRIKVLLPDNAPDPGTWSQIKAVGDVTGDGLPDLFLRAGTGFWALTGYTGVSFQEAKPMWDTVWDGREIVNVADIDLDGTPDLLWRNPDNGNMYVRHGKPGPVAGSVDLDSLTLSSKSRDGDTQYGTSWTSTNVPLVIGIPDTSGDGIPDLWAKFSDGSLRIYHPSTTNTNPPVKKVISSGWETVKSLG